MQFISGQGYSLSVKMKLPPSQRNRELGMTMICLKAKTKTRVEGLSCQSLTILKESLIFNYAKTILLLPMLLAGICDESQWIEVELTGNFAEDSQEEVEEFVIEIKPTLIDVETLVFVIEARLSGMRYLIYNFHVLSFCIGVTINAILVNIILLISSLRHFTGNKCSSSDTSLMKQDKAQNQHNERKEKEAKMEDGV